MKTSEICVCGHYDKFHQYPSDYTACFVKNCECRKFTPEVHSPSLHTSKGEQEVVNKTLSTNGGSIPSSDTQTQASTDDKNWVNMHISVFEEKLKEINRQAHDAADIYWSKEVLDAFKQGKAQGEVIGKKQAYAEVFKELDKFVFTYGGREIAINADELNKLKKKFMGAGA